jgi:hypothetical protein
MDRLDLLNEIFRTRTSKITTAALASMAVYQFACDQFGAPMLPNLWGMTGAALPWWAWLLLMQLGFLYGLFEFVRRSYRESVTTPSPSLAQDNETSLPHNLGRPVTSGVSIEVDRARRSAKADLAVRQSNVDGSVARMESALASVRRVFGVDTPPASGNGRADLKLWVDYFEVVWPFLENNNYDEAKAKASHFISTRL